MTVQKIMLTSLIALSTVLSAIAQVEIGAKGSALYSTVKVAGIGADFLDKEMNQGYNVSVFTTLPITQNFSFQPEISYNQKGFQVGSGIDIKLFNVDLPLGVSAITEINYLQAPLLGRLDFENEKGGAYFLAGPSIAYATDGKLRTKINSIIDINLTKTNINLANEDYNRFEFAGVVGTGAYININNAKLFAEFKYHHGFSDLLDDPILDIQLKNRAFGIGMGLQIAL